MLRLLSLLCLVLDSQSALAPFIKPCKISETDCVLASAKAAVPSFVKGVQDLGVKSLDPLHLDLIESNHRGLNLVFKDSTLDGLENCDLQSIKFNTSSKIKMTLQVKCNVALTGDYILNGKLLILPVQGQGKYKIDIRGVSIKVTLNMTTTSEGAAPHWHIAAWKQNFKVLTGATFDFKNLFNGNELLAQPVLEFANSNWREVMQEISPPVVDAIVGEVIHAIEALYKAVPLYELTL